MNIREKQSSEKRLIDANAFLKNILTAGIGKTIIEYSESDIGYMIRKRPTIDAVEVVRCRECVGRPFWEEDHNGVQVCLLSGLYVRSEDDFCSFGERKDGDGNG